MVMTLEKFSRVWEGRGDLVVSLGVFLPPTLTLIYNAFPHQILNAIPPPIIERAIPALLAGGRHFQL